LNLVVDIGNTNTKLAVFKGSELLKHVKLENSSLEAVKAFCEQYSIRQTILSSVANHAIELEHYFVEVGQLVVLDHSTPIPLQNKYASPETLGRDRLANAVGGMVAFPHKNVLVIDMGTCIKYDFVQNGESYLGGAISPGFVMRFKALNTFTDQLPLIEGDIFNELIGNTTTNSILSGVYNGVTKELKGVIEDYNNQFNDLKIVLAGGDAKFFKPDDISGKNSIFADIFITLRGLNEILNYNAH
jgi:type III pantothenate kinase